MPTNLLELPLHRLAHGRSGDKGNTANISVIAYHPEFFPILVEQVTVGRVAALFRHRQPTAVRRYLLPKLAALNFVLENVLAGGVNESLYLDSHGKTLAFLLLDLTLFIPADMAVQLPAAPVPQPALSRPQMFPCSRQFGHPPPIEPPRSS